MTDSKKGGREYIPAKPQTLRANSTTASWKPRHMPRKGMCFSRAHLIASIMPSVPRIPKPPGTSIPLEDWVVRNVVSDRVEDKPTSLRQQLSMHRGILQGRRLGCQAQDRKNRPTSRTMC